MTSNHHGATHSYTGIGRFVRGHARIVAALCLLQFVAYMYFFTTPIFTNHTFPGATVHPYPSYKTQYEGRWMADVVVWLQGGTGATSLLMSAAAALQAMNGVLLARLVGLSRSRDVFLVGATLALYPAFLDYYSFSIDLFYFVLADSLVLFAVLLWHSQPTSLGRAIGASALMLGAIACYQPKLALIGFLAIACILLDTASPRPAQAMPPWTLRGYATLGIAIALASAVYVATTKISLVPSPTIRTYLNSPSEAWAAAVDSYRAIGDRLLNPPRYLPPIIAWLTPCVVLAGLLMALLRSRPLASRRVLTFIVALAAIPLALNVPYILNRFTWMDAGRIIAADGYAVAFFGGWLLLASPVANLARLSVAVLCFCLLITASQQSNAAAFKTVYEVQFMTRILMRSEPLLNMPGDVPRALVICGEEPTFPWTQFVRNPPVGIHLTTSTLAPYRQVETLNYLAGWTAFRAPTSLESEDAVQSMQGRPSWPSEGSVYLHNQTVIVILQPCARDSARTWVVD